MDIESFRKAGYAAINSICDYYESLRDRPVNSQVEPGFLSRTVPEAAPEEGEAWDKISEDYQKIIMPGITHWQHPRFFAYFPCNVTFEGMLADLHMAAISNPGFNWSVSPSVTELEFIMCDWVAKMLGLSAEFTSASVSGVGGGVILNSASEVTITVSIAARERALAHLEAQELDARNEKCYEATTRNFSNETETTKPSKQDDTTNQAADWRGAKTSRLVLYGTSQTHSVAAKAALILGIPFRALKVFAKDDYALRGHTLRAAIEEDRAAGRHPFMLVATLGTTSSCAIDDIAEIASVAKDFPSLWIHVDSAYAGVALSLPEERGKMDINAINECVDSFSTNLHKWGLVQFDCSPLLVKDRGALSRALTITPEFLRTRQGDAGTVLDLRNMSLTLGRRFRALKVWFVLRSYGVQGLRHHLRRSISHAQLFLKLLEERQAPLKIVAKPRFALVVFRLEPVDIEDKDALNRAFWLALEKRSSEMTVTQTVLPEIGFCIRWCSGSPWTRDEDVKASFEVICECARSTLTLLRREQNNLSA